MKRHLTREPKKKYGHMGVLYNYGAYVFFSMLFSKFTPELMCKLLKGPICLVPSQKTRSWKIPSYVSLTCGSRPHMSLSRMIIFCNSHTFAMVLPKFSHCFLSNHCRGSSSIRFYHQHVQTHLNVCPFLS